MMRLRVNSISITEYHYRSWCGDWVMSSCDCTLGQLYPAQVRSLGVWWFDILALRHISSCNPPHHITPCLGGPSSSLPWDTVNPIRLHHQHQIDMEIQFILLSVCELFRHILYEAPESALDCWPRADPGNVLIFILAPLSSAPVSAGSASSTT